MGMFVSFLGVEESVTVEGTGWTLFMIDFTAAWSTLLTRHSAVLLMVMVTVLREKLGCMKYTNATNTVTMIMRHRQLLDLCHVTNVVTSVC